MEEKKMKKTLLRAAALCVVLCAVLIFAGCPADDDNNGDNNDGDDGQQAPESFTLAVTGVPFAGLQEGQTIGASLLNPGDVETRVAIGIDTLMKGTFTFYYPAAPGSPMPIDLTRSFSEEGSYWLALAVANMNTFEYGAVYMYTGGGQAPVAVTFPVTGPLAWVDFKVQQ